MSRLIDKDKVLNALYLDHKDVIYIDKNECAKRIEAIPDEMPMPEYIDNDLVVGHYANGMVAMNERAYQRLQLGQTERREP